MTGERAERRLAAVLAADVVGYSRLMGADEEGTLARLKALRRDIIDPAIASCRGRIVKTTGDGLLVEFASAVEAGRCGVEVQRSMAATNQGVEQDRRIDFRIDIHVGDIIFDDADIFGDGVNIAARLEGIAEAGCICISDDAQRQMRGKLDVVFEDIGSQMLKNIAEPMRTWLVRLDRTVTTPTQTSSKAQLALPDKPSIAVLPFQNMSGDSEQEYFADGMVEDIITALSRFKSLFVIARNSTFTYKGKTVDIKQVGRDLGVRYVLEGSVRKSGNRVRITGQLIDAETGAHIWADRLDGNLEDAFDLQDRMTSCIVGAVAPKLQFSEFERLRRKPTDSPSAYDTYLRGLAMMYQFKRESLQRAITLFQSAIEIDPLYASPCAAEAFTYAVRQTFGWGIATAEEKARVRALAQRVLELDKDDAVALTYAGYALVLLCFEVDDGADFIERAVAANPNLAIAWTYRGHTSLSRGYPENAIDYFTTALRLSPLDPLDFATQKGLADAYFFTGRYAEALRWALSAIRANPNWAPARLTAARAHALLGDIQSAKEAMQTAISLDPQYRISTIRNRFPLRREQDYQALVESGRLAGMPE